jgi:3-oxoacid CoA-transferase subunit A
MIAVSAHNVDIRLKFSTTPNMMTVGQPCPFGLKQMANHKLYADARSGLADVLHDDMTIMAGGFGLCGIPASLIDVIHASGIKGLTVISNNAGIDGVGLGRLLEARQIRKIIASYVGENKLFAAQLLDGTLEVEFNPQGTLAERIRAGGAGIPGFYTRTGVGTEVARGKETREFDGIPYLLERALFADLAVIHAHRADPEGNLTYRMTARNFNPVMATAARIVVAEVEEVVAAGMIASEQVITPGIFVNRLVEVKNPNKPIEQRTTRPRTALRGVL